LSLESILESYGCRKQPLLPCNETANHELGGLGDGDLFIACDPACNTGSRACVAVRYKIHVHSRVGIIVQPVRLTQDARIDLMNNVCEYDYNQFLTNQSAEGQGKAGDY
jgi:hypothetical protein